LRGKERETKKQNKNNCKYRKYSLGQYEIEKQEIQWFAKKLGTNI